jgi:hypothetical protein
VTSIILTIFGPSLLSAVLYCRQHQHSSVLGNSTLHILKHVQNLVRNTFFLSSKALFVFTATPVHSSAIGILKLKTPPYFHVIFETRAVFSFSLHNGPGSLEQRNIAL